MPDHVDAILEQWRTERPDLDTTPMAVIGRLSVAARLVEVELRRTFTAHGLDGAAFDVLATLRRSGAPHRLSPGDLTRTAMVTSGAITQRLDRLEERGLVARGPAEGDGRAVQVTLTRAGFDLVERVLPDHLATEHRLLSCLTERQRGDLAQALQGLIVSVTAAQPAGRRRAEGRGGP